MVSLIRLEPGTRFSQPELGIEGVLVSVNPCRAEVRIKQSARHVTFMGPDGNERDFIAQKYQTTSWAPSVCVVPLGRDTDFERRESMTVTTKKTPAATKGAARKAPAAKATATEAPAPKKVVTKKKSGKLSALDAAAKVLAETGKPMRTVEMIEQMAQKGYWKSPNGQTPAATLYAAILRQIHTKGKDACFKKTDRGLFALNKATVAK